jgi:hypothetical protein
MYKRERGGGVSLLFAGRFVLTLGKAPEEIMKRLSFLAIAVIACLGNASAGTLFFGDEDCLGFGCYGASDPTSGATLQGLAAGTVTLATTPFAHGFPFVPDGTDVAGTDQIYVGSVLTFAHDGYAAASQRVNGPQILTLDYSSLVLSGQTVTSLTLGLASDDFQFPPFGQPFSASVNGVANATLTSTLNSLDESGPQVRFLTLGLSTALDNPSHILTVRIDEGGDGGDGWAIDFATVGVTTTAAGVPGTPEPGTWILLATGFAAVIAARRRRV